MMSLNICDIFRKYMNSNDTKVHVDNVLKIYDFCKTCNSYNEMTEENIEGYTVYTCSKCNKSLFGCLRSR